MALSFFSKNNKIRPLVLHEYMTKKKDASKTRLKGRVTRGREGYPPRYPWYLVLKPQRVRVRVQVPDFSQKSRGYPDTNGYLASQGPALVSIQCHPVSSFDCRVKQ
jgi:hypothetical protein